MPSGFRPAFLAASSTPSIIERRAATSTTCMRGRRRARRVAGDLMVEHGLVERHCDRLGRLVADRGVALLLVLDAGSSTTRTTICWLATPRRTLFGSPASATKSLERLGQTVSVDDLTVVDEAVGSSRLAPRTTRPQSTWAAAR